MRPAASAASLLRCLGFLSVASAFHDSLNQLLPPRATACFFEDFEAPVVTKTVDTFVQSGGKANLHLKIYGPLSLESVREEVFDEAIVELVIDSDTMQLAETDSFLYDFRPKTAGTYAFCLDNAIAHILPKFIQFDIYPAVKSGENLKAEDINGGGNTKDDRTKRIKNSIDRVHKAINRLQLTQHHDRHRQQLHSELNRNSHNGLVYGSIAETIVYIIVSIFQIFFVRRWFSSRTSAAQNKHPKSWA